MITGASYNDGQCCFQTADALIQGSGVFGGGIPANLPQNEFCVSGGLFGVDITGTVRSHPHIEVSEEGYDNMDMVCCGFSGSY